MTNRFLSILIVEANHQIADNLVNVILGNGNNPIHVKNLEEAILVALQKPIGLILINLETFAPETKQFVYQISKALHINSPWMIGYVSDESKIVASYFNLNLTDVWLTGSNRFIKEKIENWKRIYFEKSRISNFLTHLYPENIISDFYHQSFSEPKKVENATIMFMDFVQFSSKSREMTPSRVARKLTKYFNRFDEIMKRFCLEKIKTIGDAYMVIGGVTENNILPAYRMCLAAIEVRNYMETQKLIAQSFNRDFWEIRIGIHTGPLVAGTIGKTKFHFDVWGDSVNIAARTEKASKPNSIIITENTFKQVTDLFEVNPYKSIEISKRGGQMNLFEVKKLKIELEYNTEMYKKSGLEPIDFARARNFIIQCLKSLLPNTCTYHNLNHTLDVEKAVIRFAKLEGIDEHSILLLRTSALLHDIGFATAYDDNEKLAIQFAHLHLPDFGYSKNDIHVVERCIAATMLTEKPKDILEALICDADLDYLGRNDYYELVDLYRLELSNHGKFFSEKEWIDFQLEFLQNKHVYYSMPAIQIRNGYKQLRILELKKRRTFL